MRTSIVVTIVALLAAVVCSERAFCLDFDFDFDPPDLGPSWFPAPDEPSGPTTGVVGQKLVFRTEGLDPLNVHEFKFAWGDGTTSGWKDTARRTHVYRAPGTYRIRARERCPLQLFTSDWSDRATVTITAAP